LQFSAEIAAEIDRFENPVTRIMNYIMDGDGQGQSYDRLAKLTDLYGPRFTGTPQLEAAIDYLHELFEEEFGAENVGLEEVTVVGWTRETEEAWLLEPLIEVDGETPVMRPIGVMGSGYSVSTMTDDGTQGAIEEEVIVVRDFEELDAKGINGTDEVAGKIVVFNQPWNGYESVWRMQGPAIASRHGAVAALTRSLGDVSMYTLHTGSTYFEDDDTIIPAACITVEDAEMLQRFQDQEKTIRIRLDLDFTREDGLTSRNLVAEIPGSEKPEEVVIFGGHIDTWDVANGPMDDGGGCIITWQALTTLKQLDIQPRRTLRLVLWTAEEVEDNPGATEYFEKHKDNINNTIMVMESDSGTFQAVGLEYSGADLGRAVVEETLKYLAPINATTVRTPAFGVDIRPWLNEGVSGFSLANQNENYFWYHHTYGDTMSIISPFNLDTCAVTWTVGALLASDFEYSSVFYEGDYPITDAAAAHNLNTLAIVLLSCLLLLKQHIA